MAALAFKSTSKRGNFGTSSATPAFARESNTGDGKKKVPPPRRSRSVSALSRSYIDPSSVSSLSNIVDFSNKRDNPLFSTSNSSSPEGFEPENPIRIAKFDDALARFDESTPKSIDSGVSEGRRGRSASRSSDSVKQFSGPRSEVGRPSLSRVDTGRRRRSVSRGTSRNSESEAECELSLAANSRNKNNNSPVVNSQKGVVLATNASKSYMRGRIKEDGICSNSQSEAEEKTIRSVFEQMKTSPSETQVNVGSHGIYETVRTEVRRAISEIRNDLANLSFMLFKLITDNTI